MPSLRTRLAAAALGTGLVLATPATALAGPRTRIAERTPGTETTERTPRDLEAVRARCLEAVRARLAALDSASGRLAASEAVTDEHQAALEAILSATGDSLTALAADITADTDAEGLKAHCRSIFEDHRVFALVLPRTRLVVGSDAAVAGAGKLVEMAGRIEEAIDEAEAGGTDVTEARAMLEAMRAAIASGQASATGVPGLVMDLTPADWNANHEVLTPARQALRSAAADLHEARQLGRQIVAGLHGTPGDSV